MCFPSHLRSSVVILTTALCLFSCKNTPKDGTPTAIGPTESVGTTAAAELPKPEMSLHAVMVDKLNLREQASKDGKVITQFPEGDFVEGTGAVSKNKEEATLRGITYTEPYLEVVSTTPEQHKGWAYKGALQLVYAGARANSPDLGKLSQLTTFLKTLNAKDINSGKKAWDYVKTNLSDANGPLADAAYVLLERFLNRMEAEGEFYKPLESIQWSQSDYEAIAAHTYDGNRYPQTKNFAANGFRLETGEGMVFPVVDPSQLNAFFLSRATPALKTYLEQLLLEQNDYGFEDGGITISINQIVDRAVFWEKFNKANPHFVLSERTRESQIWLSMVLINGANNTPVFDYESKALNPDFKQAWDYLQQKYADTDLAKNVKTFSDLVAAEGGKRTAKVEAYQTEVANRYSGE